MATTPQTPTDEKNRWRSRPLLSAAVRGVAVFTPAAVALAFSVLASRLVAPPTSGFGAKAVWWLAITLLSIGVLVAVQRVARRLLPLAALLKLSLLFPDQAPGRYKMARMVGRPRDLERQLQRSRETGHDGADTLGPQAVLELVAALSVHDRATRGHSERVRIFTDLIAAELKLPQHDLDRLRWAALLHDVGKLHVSAAILRKPGSPTAGEWTALKQHPVHGSRLIAPIAPWLGAWASAVEHHHERYDGTGYPHGLRADAISLGGRIVAVADVYETMTAARPYKRPISPSAARNELVACSGAQFDPAVVRAFLNISLGRLWRTIGISAWVSQVPLLPQLSSGLSVATTQAAPMAARGAVGFALVATVAAGAPSPSTPVASTVSPTPTTAPTAPPGVAQAPAAGHPTVTSYAPSVPTTTAPRPHPAPPPKPPKPPKAAPPPPQSEAAKPPKPPKPAKPPKSNDGGNNNSQGSGDNQDD